MTRTTRQYLHGQGGYTLIEVIISVAIGAILMAGLTSVVLTSVRAGDIASSRVEASGQLRNLEYFAYDDFAGSAVPGTGVCGTPAAPCTTQPIVLIGTRVTNSVNPAPSLSRVTYTWDGSDILDRQVGTGAAIEAATGVTSFSWYVDTSVPTTTVVVSITITVQHYSQSQTLLFYPRVNP